MKKLFIVLILLLVSVNYASAEKFTVECDKLTGTCDGASLIPYSPTEVKEIVKEVPATWYTHTKNIGKWALITVIILTILFGSVFIVEQQTVEIIERFGKYTTTRSAGLNFKIPHYG